MVRAKEGQKDDIERIRDGTNIDMQELQELVDYSKPHIETSENLLRHVEKLLEKTPDDKKLQKKKQDLED